jgi:hypothetical protein
MLVATIPDTASALPEIRTHEKNRVPACVTPARLMRFMTDRNPSLAPQFKDVAAYYKKHGEALRIRWDYAFFQMLLETNYLSYKTGRGKWGDVNPRQYNFAGIGTTGGGVPGDSFPDVSTGVLAQMQHLVAYSGEYVDNPAARRTRERQGDIIEKSKSLRRPVTFRDLTMRWAIDRRYHQSIEMIAERYRKDYCTGAMIASVRDEDEGMLPVRTAEAKPGSARAADGGAKPGAFNTAALAGTASGLLKTPQPATRSGCRVWTASYGEGKSILIRAIVGKEVHYTALQVLDGFEKSLSEGFIRTHAQGGVAIGEFPTRDAALIHAFDLCPSARQPQ